MSNEIQKALHSTISAQRNHLADMLIKGKRANIGEIRTWGGKKYKKTVQGWVPVKENNKKEQIAQETFEKVKRIKNMSREELMEYAKENGVYHTDTMKISTLRKLVIDHAEKPVTVDNYNIKKLKRALDKAAQDKHDIPYATEQAVKELKEKYPDDAARIDADMERIFEQEKASFNKPAEKQKKEKPIDKTTERYKKSVKYLMSKGKTKEEAEKITEQFIRTSPNKPLTFENTMRKAILSGKQNIPEYFEKGKRANIGEIREWGGKKYKKTVQGWVPVTENKQPKKEETKEKKTGKQDDKQNMSGQKMQQILSGIKKDDYGTMVYKDAAGNVYSAKPDESKEQFAKRLSADNDIKTGNDTSTNNQKQEAAIESAKGKFIKAKRLWNTAKADNDKEGMKKAAQVLQEQYEILSEAGVQKKTDNVFWKDALNETSKQEFPDKPPYSKIISDFENEIEEMFGIEKEELEGIDLKGAIRTAWKKYKEELEDTLYETAWSVKEDLPKKIVSEFENAIGEDDTDDVLTKMAVDGIFDKEKIAKDLGIDLSGLDDKLFKRAAYHIVKDFNEKIEEEMENLEDTLIIDEDDIDVGDNEEVDPDDVAYILNNAISKNLPDFKYKLK